ncbi:hypothetical protein [Bacillus alkalicellulosilyticus]|uniref:hypothetical protein n=1 Tax=Alkalihalobacterium alkalicellulosilyticum TaxID=1912214 RepID=UPI0009983013|nr:hypothetical protein [Bacillus alkalicellulosilyticus]
MELSLLLIFIVLIGFIKINNKLHEINKPNQSLFKVKNKVDGKSYTVYAIEKEEGGTKFLVYENNEWTWVYCDKYLPYDVDVIK